MIISIASLKQGELPLGRRCQYGMTARPARGTSSRKSGVFAAGSKRPLIKLGLSATLEASAHRAAQGSTSIRFGSGRAEGEEMSDSRPKTRRWTADEEGKLDELLDAGKEAAEIAVALSRTRQAVYARLQRLYRKRARLKAKGK